MPNISKRGLEMPASPIRKLVPLANRAVERGIKVYHLNIGQPDLPTPECGLEAMRRIDRTVLEYSPSEGIRSFREKLVKYYAKYNIIVDADDIIITTGGSEAVFFSFMACLDPGDELIVPEPAYANYMAFAISCGAVIKTIPSTIEEGFALLEIANNRLKLLYDSDYLYGEDANYSFANDERTIIQTFRTGAWYQNEAEIDENGDMYYEFGELNLLSLETNNLNRHTILIYPSDDWKEEETDIGTFSFSGIADGMLKVKMPWGIEAFEYPLQETLVVKFNK